MQDPKISDIDWKPGFSLAEKTSMGVGGRADAFAVANSEEALQALLAHAHAKGWRVWMLGGGSNTIFAGERFAGLVIQLGRPFAKVKLENQNTIVAGAAAPLSAAVKLAERNLLSGLEWGMGIPGQVGGAVAGNAGQGGEAICEWVEEVWGFTLAGEPFRFHRGEFVYSYRKSALLGLAVAGAKLLLKPSNPEAIKAKMQRFLSKRWEQPLGVKSSGCIFKNPPGDYAGRLVDAAGLKGAAVGGAEIASEHANFLVNKNGADAQEVLQLIRHVQSVVKERFDVALELEVRIVD